MPAFVLTFGIGIICVLLGVTNMKGNISSIHSYHRHRVSEEDKIPFGKQVGLATVIVGAAIAVFSILSAITLYTDNQVFILVGTAILILGIILGLFISLRAMLKYNKGIF